MKKTSFIIVSILAVLLVMLSGCVVPPVCGDGLCEEGENSYNCPQDCGFPPVQSKLTVIVSDADSGEPIPFAKVIVSGECEVGKPCGTAVMKETDKMGEATFNLNAGRYTISVSKEGYTDYSDDIAIGSGEIRRMDVELNQGAPCKEAGEASQNPSLGPNGYYGECCEGLVEIYSGPWTEECEQGEGGALICSDCGNGSCESWENKCNCPIDCTTTECIEEGETAAVYPGNECCEGLEAASTTTPEQNCEILVGAFVCINCGNGECGPGENECNCPEDCTTPAAN